MSCETARMPVVSNSETREKANKGREALGTAQCLEFAG